MISDKPGFDAMAGALLRGYKRLLLAVILTLSAGCSSVVSHPDEPLTLRLLPPLSDVQQVLKQKVLLQIQDVEKEFLVVSRLSPENTVAVVLMPTGQTVLQLQYDGKDFSQQVFLPGDVPGQELLAIMQFSVWPEAVVRDEYNALPGWHAQFSQGMRSLSWKNQLLLQVKQTAGQLTVMNHLHGYQVVINDLENDQ
ncbi:DUF3261 domain-containing protein [Aliamphritea spongicola]|uniref:DUF3261 domain-containing protein n=1 Tax=Aliamphritea spongicola TaxID=707589 RepID=UPI00196BA0E9|nr:DUF3261 domain-containing protein [Aliamphritea spongicola]MBN3564431.1 DUF3261 domain-containing protein [Aliamphritea spongicola]